MHIPKSAYEIIRNLDVDEHRTTCAYEHWEAAFSNSEYLLNHIAIVKKALGKDFSRSDLVALYKDSSSKTETKFIASMVWGYEAPLGSKRDARGPWRVLEMFTNPHHSECAIQSVTLRTEEEITKAYRLLDKTLKQCGPNFFTKHFYFLGKSQGLDFYPLIFDDRVAHGLIKISSSQQSSLDLVRVSAVRTPEAYLKYLAFAKRESERIGCSLDQIEYYLFTL